MDALYFVISLAWIYTAGKVIYLWHKEKPLEGPDAFSLVFGAITLSVIFFAKIVR